MYDFTNKPKNAICDRVLQGSIFKICTHLYLLIKAP